MRKVYLVDDPSNELNSISFFNASSGYVAFDRWVGYTLDTGHHFTPKTIRWDNVNYNGHVDVNLTFGFGIEGVKSFDQNNIVLWGEYGLVPAILRSSDGGNTFKVVFHDRFDPMQLLGGVSDMSFSPDNTVGFAVDPDHISKTTDQGQTWQKVQIMPASFFNRIQAVTNSVAIAASVENTSPRLIKTVDGGSSWQALAIPSITNGRIIGMHFLNTAKGWLSMIDNDYNQYFYQTLDGGQSWSLLNDIEATPFASAQICFINDQLGYAIYGGDNAVSKTTDGGKIWEPLSKDNNYVYLGYRFTALQALNADQIWAGGGGGLLELTTNGGGTPVPKAYFKADTTGMISTGIVQLKNFSKTSYTYKWFKNGIQISSDFNTTYTRSPERIADTISLVVFNGSISDTATKIARYFSTVGVTGFTPATAPTGATITITGTNFDQLTAVSFGGIAATQFQLISSTTIKAVVGNGATGEVRVTTQIGSAAKPGFTYLPPPTLTGFSPDVAPAGAPVILSGDNLAGTTTVTVAGVPASFIVLNDHSIRVFAPSSGSGVIRIVTPGGATQIAGFRALPTLTSYSPMEGTVGTIIKITGTSLPEINAIKIGGVPVSSFTINSAASITAVVGEGASGGITITSPNGSSAGLPFTWYEPPTITSFSPLKAAVGATVTLQGNNYDPIVANNKVFFGSVQAQVISGNTTSLQVKVPAGATFEPITVTAHKLTAFSAKPFQLIFAGGGAITTSSFSDVKELDGYPTNGTIRIGDVDGDGKLDLMTFRYGYPEDSICIQLNTSTGSEVSFGNTISLPVAENVYDYQHSLTDIDGDGKLDLLTAGNGGMFIYRNISTPGNLQFQNAVLIAINSYSPKAIACSDIDGDGKADVIVTYNGQLAVFRNTSNPGQVMMAPVKVISADAGLFISVRDLDGDGKPDIATSGGSSMLAVWKNNSTRGNINISQPTVFPGYTHGMLTVADFDGDGLPELLSSNANNNYLQLLRNLGGMQFVAQAPFTATRITSGIDAADLDGDGKVDLAFTVPWQSRLLMMKNHSTSDSIYFSIPVEIPTPAGSSTFEIGDMNGDGKDDIVTAGTTKVNVHINRVTPLPSISIFSPTVGVSGTAVNITGANFSNATDVKFGGIPASSFTIISDTKIIAIAGTGESGPVSVTNAIGTGTGRDFVFGNIPAITRLSATTGAVGNFLTIYGRHFGTERDVYFGGVKASIESASADTIKVKVPAGFTNCPVRVTTGGLTATSKELFTLTFDGGAEEFSNNSFVLALQRQGAGRPAFVDMNEDGRPDMILCYNNSFSVALNTSTTGSPSFATNTTPVNVAAGAAIILATDFDGDNKPDVITTDVTKGKISVFRNTSANGIISFSLQGTYNCYISQTTSQLAAEDIDGDGKPELLLGDYSSRTVYIYKNNSSQGQILLTDNTIDLDIGFYPTGIFCRDLDGDGLSDIGVSGNNYGLIIYRNTSNPGLISFANKITRTGGNWPSAIDVGDLDRDGKLDIAITNINGNSVSVYKNLGAAGNLSVSTASTYTTRDGPSQLFMADMNGDGKPDIFTQHVYQYGIGMFRNNSSAGNISFASRFDMIATSPFFDCTPVDIDGDGKPDLVMFRDGNTYVYLNKIGDIIKISYCEGDTRTIEATTIGNSYKWQQNTGSGFTDLADNINFVGTNTKDLQIKNIPSSWTGYHYRCLINGNEQGSLFQLQLTAQSVIPSIDIQADKPTICLGEQVKFTAQWQNGGASPVIQWKINNQNTGITANSFSFSQLKNQDEVTAVLTSNAVCAVPSSVISNVIKMTVNNPVTPTVSITAPAVVCANLPATFTTVVSNAGASPTYQWFRNNLPVGISANTYTDAQLKTGDGLFVRLTSNAQCVSAPVVISLTKVVTVTAISHPTVFISGDTSVSEGQRLTCTSTVSEAGNAPLYQWQESIQGGGWKDISGGSNPILEYEPKTTGDRIRLVVTANSPCATPSIATSDPITFTVMPGSSNSGRVTPNPVTNGQLTIDRIYIRDEWNSAEIIDMNGKRHLLKTDNISGRSVITIAVPRFKSGLYFVVLRNRDGKKLVLKFMVL